MARNLYAGICYQCGCQVPPGYGHFERNRAGCVPKWRVKCVKCASGRIIDDNDSCVKGVRRRLEKTEKQFLF